MAMTRFLPFLLAAMLLAAPLARADSFSPAQRAEIVEILRHALKTDPSILRDAITALQQDEAKRAQAASAHAIASAQDALTRTKADPVAGNPSGDVTVVEFYDPRCPYCRAMRPVTAELLHGDPGVRLVYKDIPILGDASVLESRALLAAQLQGGYLKLQDALMTSPPNATLDSVQAAAERVGLDWPRLKKDMDDPAIRQRLDANLQLAHALDIQGTPAYVIGDRLLPGAVPLSELQEAVAAARKH
jgi:protein-disulfide isomerase